MLPHLVCSVLQHLWLAAAGSHAGAEAFSAFFQPRSLPFPQRHRALPQVIPAVLPSALGISALSSGGFLPWLGILGVGFGCLFVCGFLFVFTQNTMFKLLQISTELQHSYLCSPQEFLAFRHLSWRWPNGIACTQVLTATQVPEGCEGNTRDEHGWAAKFRSRASVDTSSPTVSAGRWSSGF